MATLWHSKFSITSSIPVLLKTLRRKKRHKTLAYYEKESLSSELDKNRKKLLLLVWFFLSQLFALFSVTAKDS